MESKKRKFLSLSDKINIIKVHENEQLRIRELSDRFKIGKSQAADIIKNKDSLLKSWSTNADSSRKVKFRKSEFGAINDVVYNWFCAARAKNIPISGPLIQRKAIEVSQELKIENFKASNGWLEKFRARHSISHRVISGESNDVDLNVVNDWTCKIESICAGYDQKNIFNLDETGLFYRILPDKTMALKREKCASGKKSKERLTVMLCVNMVGDFEAPLIIGKSQKPRCFKNVNVAGLGVIWKANKRAWMTRSLLLEWLLEFDKKMGKQNRKVLLFLDNATSHPDLQLRNIKLHFFPPNTTSYSQPLDQGIIQNFKIHYRRMMLTRILSEMDNITSADQLANRFNVLQSLLWISAAIKNIGNSCVKKCFKKAGFHVPEANENIEEVDQKILLNDVMEQLPPSMAVETDTYATIDDNLCTEESSDDIKGFLPREDDSDTEQEDAVQEEDDHCTLLNYSDSIRHIEELIKFAINKEDTTLLTCLHKSRTHMEQKKIIDKQNCKQTKITDFF